MRKRSSPSAHERVLNVLASSTDVGSVHANGCALAVTSLIEIIFGDENESSQVPIERLSNVTIVSAAARMWHTNRRFHKCNGYRRKVCVSIDKILHFPLDSVTFQMCKTWVPSLPTLSSLVSLVNDTSTTNTDIIDNNKLSQSMSMTNIAKYLVQNVQYQESYIDYLIYLNYRLTPHLKNGFRIRWLEDKLDKSNLNSAPEAIRAAIIRKHLVGQTQDNTSMWQTYMAPLARFITKASIAHSDGTAPCRLDTPSGALFWALLEHEVMLKLLHQSSFDQFNIEAFHVPALITKFSTPYGECPSIFLKYNNPSKKMSTSNGLLIQFNSFDVHSILASSFASALHDRVCPRSITSKHVISQTALIKNPSPLQPQPPQSPKTTANNNNNNDDDDNNNNNNNQNNNNFKYLNNKKSSSRQVLSFRKMPTKRINNTTQQHQTTPRIIYHPSVLAESAKPKSINSFPIQSWNVLSRFEPSSMKTRAQCFYSKDIPVSTLTYTKDNRKIISRPQTARRPVEEKTTKSNVDGLNINKNLISWQRWDHKKMHSAPIEAKQKIRRFTAKTPFLIRSETARQSKIERLKKQFSKDLNRNDKRTYVNVG